MSQQHVIHRTKRELFELRQVSNISTSGSYSMRKVPNELNILGRNRQHLKKRDLGEIEKIRRAEREASQLFNDAYWSGQWYMVHELRNLNIKYIFVQMLSCYQLNFAKNKNSRSYLKIRLAPPGSHCYYSPPKLPVCLVDL